MIMENLDNQINKENCLEITAQRQNFTEIKPWLEKALDEINCQGKPRKQLLIAVDEIFTNIASYAYDTPDGTAQIKINYNETETTVELKFVDSGIPYNPLTQDDPDIKQRIEERTVGGLGIFMVKKMMDSIEYHREDNKNILILKKKIA